MLRKREADRGDDMKNVKEFSKGFVFLSVLYVAVGLVLLVLPSVSANVINYGLGVVLIVVGVTYGIGFFIGNKRKEGYLQVDLVIGVICAAFGIFILVTPGFFGMILPLAVAVVLLVGAMSKIQNAFSMRRLMIRHWYLALIGAIVIIVLAVFLILDPFRMTDRQKFFYIGICLILDGTTNLISLISIRVRSKRIEKIRKKDPGTDIEALFTSEWEKADAKKAQRKAARNTENEKEIVIEAKDVTEEEPAQNEPEETGFTAALEEKGTEESGDVWDADFEEPEEAKPEDESGELT